MWIKRRKPAFLRAIVILSVGAIVFQSGCGMQFRNLRFEGQRALINGNYAAARGFFEDANDLRPAHAVTLHDLAVCCEYFAGQRLEEGNRVAAERELDRAIAYYDRAINVHPGMQAALTGKNRALELRGHVDEALAHARWASRFVGPSAKQQVFLAAELEERGDLDGALLGYRLAVAMEPNNPDALVEMGRFLVRRGRTQEALIHLKKAYSIDPAQVSAAEVLLTLEGSQGPGAKRP